MWNRQHFVKDPASGKRVARPNLPTAWIIEPVPALRIIEPNLWTAAQQRLKAARQIVTDERPDVRGADIAGTPGSSLGSRLVPPVGRPGCFQGWCAAVSAAAA